MVRFIVTLVLGLVATSSIAHEATFGVRGESLPVHHLITFRAEAQETEVDFVLRVGAFLDRYTQVNGYEACTDLIIQEGRLVARVTTNESHVGCLAVTYAGDELVGRSIHSHPAVGVVRLNLADNTFLRGDRGRQGADRRGTLRTRPGVSPTDRLSGPGYLVENGQVVFFSSQQPDRVVGPVAASPLPPSMLAALQE